MGTPGLWVCGILGKAHGLHGELYLNPAPDGVEYLRLGEVFYLAPRGEAANDIDAPLTACHARRVGGTDRRPIVALDLAATREAAIAIQGRELLAAGDELDALPHYVVGALIGLPVETAGGRPLGTVSDVLQTPSHELLEILTAASTTILVPLVEELVTVDEEAGMIRVVDGLLDDSVT